MAKKKQYPLRVDPQIFEQIEHWANDELRSVNAHIEYLLRDALKRHGRLKKPMAPEQSTPQSTHSSDTSSPKP